MRPASLVCAVVVTAWVVAACGGSSSAGGSSSGGGTSTSASTAASQLASASAEAFCTTFKTASEKFSSDNTFPTKSQTDEVRKFADEIEATAPAEMQGPAKGLATYFRAVADGVDKNGSNPSPNPSALAAFAASIQAIGDWAQTHCTG